MSRRAPSDPPITSSTERSAAIPSRARATSRCAARSTATIAGRTGLPVHVALRRAVSGKGAALAFAKRPASRLATDGAAFCSVSTIGTRHATAAITPGTDA